MSPKKMPKNTKDTKKSSNKTVIIDDVLDSEAPPASESEIVTSDVEETEGIDDEDIEETTSSDENDDVYVETESDEEKDLKDGDVKLEEECDYELDEQVVPPSIVKKERTKRSTRPVLTYYERVKVLSVRAAQISVGAKVFVSGVENRSPLEIAELELQQGLIPFVVIRSFPDNTYERWKVAELVHSDLARNETFI
jgi:DNA-directed RNA polymerase subunit K/omega